MAIMSAVPLIAMLGLLIVLQALNGMAVTEDQTVVRVLVATLLVSVGAAALFENRLASLLRAGSAYCKQSRLTIGICGVFSDWRRKMPGKSPSAIEATIVATIISVSSCLIFYSASVHSPTLDEPAHLAAGLSHYRFKTYTLYRVNPPLVRLIAVLPVWLMEHTEDWSRYVDSDRQRPEFLVGEDFIAANKERSQSLVRVARMMCIPFFWLGAWACYAWSRDLFGGRAGIGASLLWCFAPDVLAHGSLMTPDLAAAVLCVSSSYIFYKWLCAPTVWRAAACGVMLGASLSTKSTLLMLLFTWPLTWLALRFTRGARSRSLAVDLSHHLLMLLICFYLVNSLYSFSGSFMALRDYSFSSDLFREMQSRVVSFPVPLPFDYVKGLDEQRLQFENYGGRFYLRGQWSEHGWFYYYLYALLTKTAVGTFALFAGSLCLLIRNRKEFSPEGLLSLGLTPVILFTVVSLNTGINEHPRYALPCFPFVCIVASAALMRSPRGISDEAPKGRLFLRGIGTDWATLAVVFALASSLWCFPHSLSYFNEAAGGPHNGHRHLLGSAVDWGQDFLYAKKWLASHQVPEFDGVIGCSLYEPQDLGLNYSAIRFQSSQNNTGVTPLPGLYLLSANVCSGEERMSFNANGTLQFFGAEKIKWIANRNRLDTIGYSLWVYRVESVQDRDQ